MLVGVFKKKPCVIATDADRVYVNLPDCIGRLLWWLGKRQNKGGSK